MMYRVLFDSNDGSEEHGYMLVFKKSLEDLAAIGADLNEGLRIVIYMPEELEYEAILKYDQKAKMWLGVPVPGTKKFIGAALNWIQQTVSREG